MKKVRYIQVRTGMMTINVPIVEDEPKEKPAEKPNEKKVQEDMK